MADKRLTVLIPVSLCNRFNRYLQAQGITASSLVQALIQGHLNDHYPES